MKKKPMGYWIEARIIRRAKQYDTMTEFWRENRGAYHAAERKGLIPKIRKFMKVPKGCRKHRHVYLIEFSNGDFYLGLGNPKQRLYSHKAKFRDWFEKYEYTITISEKKLSPKKSSELEMFMIAYARDNNMPLLNSDRSPGGQLGCGGLKWTKSEVKKAIRSCVTHEEFRKKYKNAHARLREYGLVDYANRHLKRKKRVPFKRFSKSECRKAASQYRTRSDFAVHDKVKFNDSYKSGWLDEFFPVKGHQLNRKWTLEVLEDFTQDMKSRSELFRTARGAYHAAHKNGWLDILFKDNGKTRPKGTLTYEYCLDVCLQFERLRDLYVQDNPVYLKVKRAGWEKTHFAHLKMRKMKKRGS